VKLLTSFAVAPFGALDVVAGFDVHEEKLDVVEIVANFTSNCNQSNVRLYELLLDSSLTSHHC